MQTAYNKVERTQQMVAVLGNGLIYEMQPFTNDTEISGFPKLTVWMALDTPDTDFQVVLYELLPDVRSIALCVDRMRAGYRESLKRETLVEIGREDSEAFVAASVHFIERWRALKRLEPLDKRRNY